MAWLKVTVMGLAGWMPIPLDPMPKGMVEATRGLPVVNDQA
jgi:hypothetical protein